MIELEDIAEDNEAHPVCCSFACEHGRLCPYRQKKRAERRQGPSILRKIFGWMMKERRSGFDRRQRVDIGQSDIWKK